MRRKASSILRNGWEVTGEQQRARAAEGDGGPAAAWQRWKPCGSEWQEPCYVHFIYSVLFPHYARAFSITSFSLSVSL